MIDFESESWFENCEWTRRGVGLHALRLSETGLDTRMIAGLLQSVSEEAIYLNGEASWKIHG